MKWIWNRGNEVYKKSIKTIITKVGTNPAGPVKKETL